MPIVQQPQSPCPHDFPSWWKRHRMGVVYGTIWQCDLCKNTYRWTGSVYGGPYWKLHNPIRTRGGSTS